MTTCQHCGSEMLFKETDYYDFDHYLCLGCGAEFLYPGWWYGEPEYDDEADEIDDF